MKQSNPNWANDLVQRLDELGKHEAKVGWFKNALEEDGTPSATVASAHEYGVPSKNIPPRLGMRETVAKKEKSWRQLAEHLASQVMQGTLKPKELVELLARRARGDFFKRINSNPPPKLKKKTIQRRKRKGITHETTLVATGRMIEQLEIKVD